MASKTITLAIVDDHALFRRGIANIIQAKGNRYKVLFEASNGSELEALLQQHPQPDILITDIHMPVMNGFKTISWLKQHYPEIRIMALSMEEEEESILRMFKAGVHGYLSKDTDPVELDHALQSIYLKGHYYANDLASKLVDGLKQTGEREGIDQAIASLTENELRFLKLACTEYTYREIAEIMCLSPKTLDHYRVSLFDKFQVKSRVGLVMLALEYQIVE